MVLDIRDGFVRVWRADWRIPWPCGLRFDETADMVERLRLCWGVVHRFESVLGAPGPILMGLKKTKRMND